MTATDDRPAHDHRCTFVPPYLLRQLDQAGPHELRAGTAGSTLELDERIRAKRANAPREPRETAVAPAASGGRVVHTAANTEQLPGEVARAQDAPATGDAAVDEAYDHAGIVLDLFATAFDRHSVDDADSTLSITVHYGTDYDNAFWDGSQLVFGDGDGQIFDRFTKPMDVMAHEFTHGVTQYTAGLDYQGQSGALNESVSDVFASMAKQRSLGQTADQADWLIGQGLFLPSVHGVALRSMIEPGTAYDDPQIGKDPQVGSMTDYVDTTDDNGGVHINSGIPNRAFALAALGVGGNSWEQAGHVWYDALTSGEVTSSADFVSFAQATVSSAGRLFPDDTAVADHVRQAWTQVGVLTAGDQPAEPPAPGPAPADGGAGTTPAPGSSSPAPSGTSSTPAPTPGSGGTGDPDGQPGSGGQPGPAGDPADVVAVRRTGGFAGAVKARALDLTADPGGSEVRELLTSVDLQTLSRSSAAPDRFVYTLEYGDTQVTLPEQDLTPALHRVVQIVLDRGGVQLG